jgi:hypothetical protein
MADERPPRRRRIPDSIDVRSIDLGPSFDAAAWAEDARDVLDYIAHGSGGGINPARRRTQRYITALRNLLEQHPSFRGHRVSEDLTVLALALDALDGGVVHPVVAKVEVGGSPAETVLDRQWRRLVLQCCQHLISCGMPRPVAYRVLSKELGEIGVDLTAGTIKRWFQRTLPGRKGEPELPADAEWLAAHVSGGRSESVEDGQRTVRTWLRLPIVQAVRP